MLNTLLVKIENLNVNKIYKGMPSSQTRRYS